MLSLIIAKTYSSTVKDFTANIKYENCNFARAEFYYIPDTMFTDRIACWDFGDGSEFCNSYTNAASRNYSTPGSYTVTLTLIRKGDTTVICKPNLITIRNTPKVDFSYSVSDSLYIAPLTLEFNNKVEKGDGDSLKYYWDFGDSTSSTEKHTKHTFTKSGTYYVSLKVTDNLDCGASYGQQIIVKDTAQRGEFSFIKSSCHQDYYTFVPVEKHYQVLNDTLKIFGMYNGNCGATKTATIRYKGDTIVIKSWQSGPFTTCDCEFYFEINIPNYSKDSAIILFDGERLKTGISAIPKINQLDKSIRIYPNPVSNNFLLESDDNSIFPLTIILKDINGRKIQENTVYTSKTNVNTSDLKAGIYVLYLYSKQGFATKKIIKI